MLLRTFTALLRLRYWLEAQPMSVLTESEKRDHIRYWQCVTGHQIFIETGTYLGETTLAMAQVFDHCYTIEYDRSLYERANAIFTNRKNITS